MAQLTALQSSISIDEMREKGFQDLKLALEKKDWELADLSEKLRLCLARVRALEEFEIPQLKDNILQK